MDDIAFVQACLDDISGDTAWPLLQQRVVTLTRRLRYGLFQFNSADIEDVVQNVMVSLLENERLLLRKFILNPRNFSGFLAGIIKNTAREYLRRNPRRLTLEVIGDLTDANSNDFIERLLNEELHQQLTVVFNELEDIDYIILREYNRGRSVKDIADFLTRTKGELITETKVRQRKSRAIKKVKKKLGI